MPRKDKYYFLIRNSISGPLCVAIRRKGRGWRPAKGAPVFAQAYVTGPDAKPNPNLRGLPVPLTWDEVQALDTVVKVRPAARHEAAREVVIADQVWDYSVKPVSKRLQDRALRWLADLYGCEPDLERVKRRVYKGTDCGAWVTVGDSGVTIGSIVEGSDAEVAPETIRLTSRMTKAEFISRWRAAVQGVEDEASRLWDEANAHEEEEEEEEDTDETR